MARIAAGKRASHGVPASKPSKKKKAKSDKVNSDKRVYITVVFDIEDKGMGMKPDERQHLSGYLASALAATRAYQVVPRDRLRRALRAQKTESLRRCYDQRCQIQIGRELAAQKLLAPQVIKFGSRCMVTAVLYDLRRAASERGGRAEGQCDKAALLRSIETVIKQLTA